MPTGPLIAIHSQHHEPSGIVPAAALVEAAADAGYRTVALVDFLSLRAAPSFLKACRERSVHPLLGMTLNISCDSSGGADQARDVFDLAIQDHTDGPRSSNEWVTLIALDPGGFKTLLGLQQRALDSPHGCIPKELLAESTDGLHLILGPPGSILERVVSGRRSWRTAPYLEPLLNLFPRSRTSFGGLYSGSDDLALGLRVDRLEKLPKKISPLAVHWMAYRNTGERFWGLAKKTLFDTGPPYEIDSQLTLEHPHGIQVAFQGLSGALSRVEKMTPPESDLTRHFRSSPPVYPSPRGTDTHSFFWTLAQEVAISIGLIKRPEYKDRLYEEFQFFKQTEWPTLFLFLWDLRRRTGLPPGTLRVAEDWIASSLFAHILGLSRVDPIRANLNFEPRPLSSSSVESLTLEVECPHGWEKHLLTAAEQLVGISKTVLLKHLSPLSESKLQRVGFQILSQWEEFGFGGNRPDHPPHLPRYLVDQQHSTHPVFSLHLSGRALGFHPTADDESSRLVSFDHGDRNLLGGLNLVLGSKALLTLASASRYRGVTDTSDEAEIPHESVTDWIERHEGQVFYGKPYADDSGHFEVMGLSPSFTRLLTLPESTGYRPLLWKWLTESSPQTLNQLADYLALAYHWTFWSNRPTYRVRAQSNPFGGDSPSPPPWWEAWDLLLKQSKLDPRVTGRLSSVLEQRTRPTGGWILYRETLESALSEALEWNTERVKDFLGGGTEDGSFYSEFVNDFSPFTAEDRQQFLDFLGHPNPLPERIVFLKKAAEVLAATDAYVSDPCAWAALSSYLYTHELEERRTLYRMLRGSGCSIRVPRHLEAIPFSTSKQRAELTLGLIDLYGIGPSIATELTGNRRYGSPHNLFMALPKDARPFHFASWLRKNESVLTLSLVESLIHLGYFEGCEPNREKLLEIAVDRYERRSSKKDSLQQTLFELGETHGISGESISIPSSPERALKKPIEWEISGLRIPLSGDPLDVFHSAIPAHWREGTGNPSSSAGLQAGWVYDLEIFSKPHPSIEKGEAASSGNVAIYFLLHTQTGSFMVEDPDGVSLSTIPEETIPEPRLDGHRIHFRDPLCIIVDVTSRPKKGSHRIPTFRLIGIESVPDLIKKQGAWAGIRVVAGDPKPALLDDLRGLADWFSQDLGDSSTLLEIGAPDSLNPLHFIRRRRKIFPPTRVVASEILVDRLNQIPGVSSVEILPRQTPLFKPEKEGSI